MTITFHKRESKKKEIKKIIKKESNHVLTSSLSYNNLPAHTTNRQNKIKYKIRLLK
ncbi:hypothetical protein LguiB_018982 [Lonicera macranthoides]